VNILVDASVWSLAMRRDSPVDCREVARLKVALEGGEGVFTTGIILQELLQGFNGPKAQKNIIETFSLLPFIIPERRDHIEAAELKVKLRQKGIQAGTIYALLVQLCWRHGLSLLSADNDFKHISKHIPLTLIVA
jgi:predicted nucleic acid-binding protein